MDCHYLSDELTKLLGLPQPAVGIKLIKAGEISKEYKTEGKYTFCQFIMKAREGSKLLAEADNITCPNGASALGFREVPDKLRSGELLETIGAFLKEAGREAVESIPRFELDEFKGIALAPLAAVDYEPDIVILETLPEHVMWLNLASLHSGAAA